MQKGEQTKTALPHTVSRANLLSFKPLPTFKFFNLSPKLEFFTKQYKPIKLSSHNSMAMHDRLASLSPGLRLRLIAGASIAGFVLSLLAVGPRFSAVIAFFWPLLVSTGFVLVAVAVLMRVAPPPPAGESVSGEELLEFVAGRRPEISPELREGGDGEPEHEKSQ